MSCSPLPTSSNCASPSPPRHAGLLDARRLALMQPTALVVNTARGALVDHQALIAAITEGRLGGYATDVWEPEPPPAADLAALGDRLLVTPHVAAITDVTYREICVRHRQRRPRRPRQRDRWVFRGPFRPLNTHRLR